MGSYSRAFLYGIGATGVGVLVAQKYFQTSAVFATCAFITFGLASLLEEFLDNNRRQIWDNKTSSWVANQVLALRLVSIFFGIFLSAFFFGPEQSNSSTPELELLFKNIPQDLFMHNLRVMAICAVLSFLYRAGGLMLVLSWNALAWAHDLSLCIMATLDNGPAWAGWALSAAILPHLLLEVLAYLLAGMAGVFFSKALSKYALNSAEFAQVTKACLAITTVAVVGLAGAVTAEIFLAQPLYSSLSNM